MRIKLVLFGIIAALFAGAGFAADETSEVKVTVFTGAEMIDGTGAKPRKGLAIVVKGEKIVAVERERGFTPPEGAEIVDMSGQYVLPGLINVHEHMNTPPKASYTEAMMRRELYGGVTAVRDPADDLRLLSEIARAARLNEIPSPDIYYAVMMAGPSFYEDPRTQASSSGGYAGQVPWMQAVTDETDIPLAIAMARGTSASGIKIYANLPAHLVKALTEEAHKQGTQSWSHSMIFPTTPEEAVDAGVDVLSHACDIAYQAFDKRPTTYPDRGNYPIPTEDFVDGDNPAVAALYEKMSSKGTILDPTLYVYRPRERPAGARPQNGEEYTPRCTYELTQALTLQAYRAGVDIATGTDGFTPWQEPYLSVHTEMELLQDTGMKPLDIIKSATLIGAKVLGEEEEMGTIEAGKLANMVFVSQNPTKDVTNLKSVTLVVKRGEQYPRSDYIPLTEEDARPRPMDSVKILPLPKDSEN